MGFSTPMMIALAAAAGGTYLQHQETEKAANRQQQAINDALARQDEYAAKARQVATQNAEQYDPKTRLEKYDEAATKAGDSLAQTLATVTESQPSTSLAASGKMSNEFLAGSARAKAAETERALQMARLMGKVRAPTDLTQQEGYANADAASRIGVLAGNAAGAYRAAQPGINAAGRTNSGTMLAAGLMSNLGKAALMGSAGGAAGGSNAAAMSGAASKGTTFFAG